MTMFSVQIPELRKAIQDISLPIIEAYNERFEEENEADPAMVADGLLQLCDILQTVESRTQASDPNQATDEKVITLDDLSRLGEYGLELFQDMGAWAGQIGLDEPREQLQLLIVPMAVWLARHGAELRSLEPVTDAIASLANHTQDADDLEQLSDFMGEIMEAVASPLKQDIERDDLLSPWRILNLNRGIIATRSHNPVLMEEVFQELVENLPQDAPAFFKEGMEQMEALNYPEPVRAVMLKYFSEWVTPTLH